MYEVKLPLIQVLWAGRGEPAKLEKWGYLFTCPWHFACKFPIRWSGGKNSQTKIVTFFTEAPFHWKLLKIDIWSTKSIRKDVLIFQVWGSSPAPHTLPVFRVYLLHTQASGNGLFIGSVAAAIAVRGKWNSRSMNYSPNHFCTICHCNESF